MPQGTGQLESEKLEPVSWPWELLFHFNGKGTKERNPWFMRCEQNL